MKNIKCDTSHNYILFRRYLVCWLLCWLVTYSLSAQEIALDVFAGLKTNDPNLNIITMVASDNHGNVFLAGKYNDKIEFEGGSLESHADESNLFLIKYDHEGKVVFARSIGASDDGSSINGNNAEVFLSEIGADQEGNIFLLVTLNIRNNNNGTIKFYDENYGIDYEYTASSGQKDGFIVKYSPDGTLLAHNRISSMNLGGSFALDGQGQLYLAGLSTLDKIFWMKLDNNLLVLSGQKTLIEIVGGSGNLDIRKLVLDSEGNIVLAGMFPGTTSFSGKNMTSGTASNQDIYLAKYDHNGSFLAANQMQPMNNNNKATFKDMDKDGQGNIYMTGFFNGTLSFPPNTFPPIQEIGGNDIFIAKFNSQLEPVYAFPLGSKDYDEAKGIAVHGDYFYLAGFITSQVDFDVKEGQFLLDGGGHFDNFIAKYENASGELVYAFNFSSDDGNTRGNDVAIYGADGRKEIYYTGYFSGKTKFNPYTDGGVQDGNKDIFWARYLEKVDKDDSLALVSFYNSMNGDSWENHTGWLAPLVPVEEWYGIIVSPDRYITRIELGNNGLEGSLPSNFIELLHGQFLTKVDVSDNNLDGNIPAIKATSIDLSHNQFTGSIASGLQADSLDLSHNLFANLSLSGSQVQKHLSIEENQLTFEDILPLVNNNFTLTYAPQAKVGEEKTVILDSIETSYTISLGIDPTVTDNKYEWFRNGAFFRETTVAELTLAIPQETGTFTCLITNSGAPALTLESLPVTLIREGEPNTISFNGSNMFVADLDQDEDGDPDIITVFEDEVKLNWYENSSGGEFTEKELAPIEKGRVVHVADINHDGFQDIITGFDQIVWYKGSNDLGFNEHSVISGEAISTYGIQTADFDGDGDLDMVVASQQENELKWFQNVGNGSFEAKSLVLNNPHGAIEVAVPDINGDSLPDIVVAYREINNPEEGEEAGGGKIVYFLNLGGGNFGVEAVITDAIDHPETIFAADLNGDNKPDILSASSDDNRIAWYENQTVGGVTGFGSPVNISVSLSSPKAVYATDMDGDGDMDVISGTFKGDNPRTVWFENDEVFFGTENILISEHTRWLTASDMDGDGDQDIITSKFFNKEIVLVKNNIQPVVNPLFLRFFPETTFAGEDITISGANLGSNVQHLEVKVADSIATVLEVNEGGTRLVAKVPELLYPGTYDITVTFIDKSVSREEKLTVVPQITSLSDTLGLAGSGLKVMGKNFRSQTGDIKVEIGTSQFEVHPQNLNAEGTEITFQVPEDLETGTYQVKVIVNGLETESRNFRVVNDTTAPVILSDNFDTLKLRDQQPLPLRVSIGDPESRINKITAHFSGISGDFDGGSEEFEPATNTYDLILDIPFNIADELGVKYRLIATNTSGLADTLEHYTYREYNITNREIYNITNEAPTQKDYRIIAIPFESGPVSEIWQGEDINQYTKKDWRLFRYIADDYQEYQEGGFSSFESGEGYMFIQKNFSFDVQGQVSPLDHEEEGYTEISLEPDWNLIGNPYPFALDWNKVREANPEVTVSDKLKVYSGGYVDQSSLEAYQGGWVKLEGGSNKVLKVPVSARMGGNARYAHSEKGGHKPNTLSSWFMELDVVSDELVYHLGGFGMHPEARLENDRFDDYPVPRFLDYLELTFENPAIRNIPLTKDVVPVTDSYVWKFEVASNLRPQMAQLEWGDSFSGGQELQLFLLDLQNNQVVNMRDQQHYHFYLGNNSRTFQIFYGTRGKVEALMIPEQVRVGSPFPNPAVNEIWFPVALPKYRGPVEMQIDLFNSNGEFITSLKQDEVQPGYQTLRWNRQGRHLPPGLYFYRVSISGESQVYTGKIIWQ